MQKYYIYITILGFFLSIHINSFAADKTIDFTRDIKPILESNCLVCHGSGDLSADFSLATQSSLLRGGLSGRVVIPGDADKSFLVQLIEHTAKPHMPFGLPKLPDEQIQHIRKWIDEGAVYDAPLIEGVDEEHQDAIEQKKDLWSLKPIRDVQPPQLDSDWIRTPIDAFVLHTLQEKNLSPSIEADKRTLIRRLTVALHGLLPTADEVEKFMMDDSPDSYENLVDSLLASPRFGEHWGQHWLDITKYADTYGYDQDIKRPHAWRYRDYVIQSFNNDKPYNQFILEQIAGDLIDPEQPTAAIATGFLTTGPWDNEAANSSPMIQKKFRMDQLDDILTTVITSTVAITVNCARCHDHKFDPVPQKDYYQLAAVFAGTQYGDRVISDIDENEREQLLEPIDNRHRYLESQLARLQNQPIQLTDLISGGNGYGSGDDENGINPQNGLNIKKRNKEFDDVPVNQIIRPENLFIDSIFVPDGGKEESVSTTSTGIAINDVPETSGETWGTIHTETIEQEIDGKEVELPAILLHTNKGITFDLMYLRTQNPDLVLKELTSDTQLSEKSNSELRVYVDGELKSTHTSTQQFDRVSFPILADNRFITFISTDGGDGINNDFVYLVNPRIITITKINHSPLEIKTQFSLLKQQMAELKKERDRVPEVQYAFANITQKPHEVNLLRRGELSSPVDEVAPGTLSLFDSLPTVFGGKDIPEGERRVALAQWIVHPENTLTRRVIVNRIWQHLIGQGIVSTPSDFGHNGTLPSHPELLDWLANELVRHNWSIKSMIKQVVISNVFRQQSVSREDADDIDSSNQWLWRMNPKRMSAEAIRDSILLVTGRLNPQMGGPGYEPFEFEDKFSPDYHYFTENKPDHWRRSIYRFMVRSKPSQFMAVFDCPNPTNLSPVRSTTTTPLQPLAMMNNEFVLLQAKYLAEKISEKYSKVAVHQINEAFKLTLMRSPIENENTIAKTLVENHGLHALCRMLFNANEFIYID